MDTSAQTASNSKAMHWTGRVISGLTVVFLLFTVGVGFVKPEMLTEGMKHMGYPEQLARTILWLELACVIIYAIPQTAVFGAILLTAYLGGATATHVRITESPAMAIGVAILAWLGIFLREPRLRALVPLRKL